MVSRNRAGEASTRPSFPRPLPSEPKRFLCVPPYFETSVKRSKAAVLATVWKKNQGKKFKVFYNFEVLTVVPAAKPGLPHEASWPLISLESKLLVLAISSRYLFQSENESLGEFLQTFQSILIKIFETF